MSRQGRAGIDRRAERQRIGGRVPERDGHAGVDHLADERQRVGAFRGERQERDPSSRRVLKALEFVPIGIMNGVKGMSAPIAVDMGDVRPFEMNPEHAAVDVDVLIAGRVDRGEAGFQGVHRRGDEGRATSRRAKKRLRGRFRPPGPAEGSASENETPQRPLFWMSQNAGAIQSSCGVIVFDPSIGSTALIRSPFRVKRTHQPV